MPEATNGNVAIINRFSGRAFIKGSNKKIYVLDVERSTSLRDGRGVHMGMFLQPAMFTLEECSAGEHPYEELVNYVVLAHKQERCLMMLVMALDPNLESETREAAAELVLESIRDTEIKGWLVKRLGDASSWRDTADITGLPSNDLKMFMLTLP